MRFVDGCPGKWSFHEIRAIYSRKYLLQPTAIEIFLANRTSIMFNFANNDIVRKVVTILPRVGIGTGYGLPQTRKISLASPRQLFRWSNMTRHGLITYGQIATYIRITLKAILLSIIKSLDESRNFKL